MMFTNENNEQESILVEKMIDHKRYTKWNTNNGYVRSCTGSKNESIPIGEGLSISVEDIPQAYSHFTYLASGRKYLVCDLQGALNTNVSPPVFELTDPAIHYKTQTNRMTFGSSDGGEEGIQNFLQSHECSALCRMVCRRWLKDPVVSEAIHCKNILENSPKNNKRVRFAL